MAAIDDALAEARARHPHWGVWISSAGRYWATRLGNLRLTESVHPGWAMTVDASSLAELETCIKTQERVRAGMTPDAQPLAGPAMGSAWQSARSGQPRPLDAGTFVLVTLPTSPFWARRYTRSFLDSCRGISADLSETAELLVSELVTNAVRFAGDPARLLRYSERANASLISLSLRHFREVLLIEVYDTNSNPSILSGTDDYAENGRGLILVGALSKEWSYFFPPGGGKVVYCFLEIR